MKIQAAFCITMILLFYQNDLQAQSKQEPEISKWHIQTGFGYYDPMAAGGKGNIFFTEIGHELPTGFIAGLGFGFSDVFEEYSETDIPLYGGYRSYHNYYLIRFFLNKEFSIGKNQTINIGTGLLYEQVRYAEPFTRLIPQFNEQGELIEYGLSTGINRSSNYNIDIGQILHADYNYHFGKLGVGLRAEIHYLYAVGFGGFMLSPLLTFSF